jgi:tetratricopeptide (TPR) repeat protein
VLNPDRDFNTTVLTSDEGQLARADLLTSESAPIYETLLKSGKYIAEANEGLAMLAMRSGDMERARRYMEAARSAGTMNVIALTAYGSLQTDPERAIAILKEALTIDPKYAEAHWALGEKISDKPRRLAEWKQAVALAPRNIDWWNRYAQLCLDQKQYAEASRAWLTAAQAAPDPGKREEFLAKRAQIEQLRLDDEEAQRQREAAARQAEIDRLKNQARKEIAELESRANAKPLSKQELANTVEWTEIHGAGALSGTLTRVQCSGRQYQLEVREESGKVQRLWIADASQVELSGPDAELGCTLAKPRAVSISYKVSDAKKGYAGEVTGIEFR